MRLRPSIKRLAGVLAVTLLSITSAQGFDRNDVPLRNWDGFGGNLNWVYEALEKVVLAGLADQVLLTTKPITRVAAARIVAQAVERLREDQYGDYNHRGYLEEIVYRLVGEFGRDLQEMGVSTPLNREKPVGRIQLKPVSHAQVGTRFATGSDRLINEFGLDVDKGANFLTTLAGRGQVGDYFSFYYQPTFRRTSDHVQGKLQTGYGKLTFKNFQVLAGRESLWWGPGYRGSMSFSGNAFPLDQIRIGSAEPFHLPWFLKYLGPMQTHLFVSQLGEDRTVPNTKLAGYRINFAPTKFMELGFTRAFQFGGDTRPDPNFGQFLRLLLDGGVDDPSSPLQVNNVMSLDATFRWPDAGRYLLFMRDLSLYGELGWDDTQEIGVTLWFIPTGSIVPRKPGGLVGFLMTGFLGDPYLDFRFEYARTSDIQFTNFLYPSGWTNRGNVMSHFIGNDGWEFFGRLSRQMTSDLLLAFEVSVAQIGNADKTSVNQSKERRDSFGIDLSYRLSKKSSLFIGYDFAHVKNKNFKSGKSGNESVFQIQFTRSFELAE